MHRGHVRLWRKVQDSEFWSHGANAIAMFAYLLVRANWKEAWHDGTKVGPGELLVSIRDAADDLKIGHKAARLALKTLQNCDVIRAQGMAQVGTIVTFLKWDTYGSANYDEGTSGGKIGAQEGHILKKVRRKTKEPLAQSTPKQPDLPGLGEPPKEKDRADCHKVIDEYCRGFKERTGEDAHIDWIKHTASAKKLLQERPLDKLMALAYEFGSNPPRQNIDKGMLGFEHLGWSIPTLIGRRA